MEKTIFARITKRIASEMTPLLKRSQRITRKELRRKTKGIDSNNNKPVTGFVHTSLEKENPFMTRFPTLPIATRWGMGIGALLLSIAAGLTFYAFFLTPYFSTDGESYSLSTLWDDVPISHNSPVPVYYHTISITAAQLAFNSQIQITSCEMSYDEVTNTCTVRDATLFILTEGSSPIDAKDSGLFLLLLLSAGVILVFSLLQIALCMRGKCFKRLSRLSFLLFLFPTIFSLVLMVIKILKDAQYVHLYFNTAPASTVDDYLSAITIQEAYDSGHMLLWGAFFLALAGSLIFGFWFTRDEPLSINPQNLVTYVK